MRDLTSASGMVLAGAYRVEALLGRGGMGAVYRGVQLSVDRPVAIKLLSPPDADDDLVALMLKRFEREAMATSRLSHPNTVRLYDFGNADGLPFLVLELLAGKTLRQRLREEGALASREVLSILRQVASALTEAHEHGIIHRDLKPDNIFLSQVTGLPDLVKVMDFGIAAWRESETNITGHQMIGTIRYMAPEQLTAGKPGRPTDIYALGVVAFEMLTGAAPFQGRPEAVMARHLLDPRPSLPPALEAAWGPLIDKMMAKDPEHRFQDTSALLAALEDARAALEGIARPADLAAYRDQLATEPSSLRRATTSPALAHISAQETAGGGRLEPRRSRRGYWVGAALFLVGAGAAALTIALTQGGGAAREPGELVVATLHQEPPGPAVAAPPPAKGDEAAAEHATEDAPDDGAEAAAPVVPAVPVITVPAIPPPPELPSPVKVHVTSNPEGARISLVAGQQRRLVCARAPCDVELEPSDEPVTFVAVLSRHAPARAEVLPTAGAEQSVELVLKPLRIPTERAPFELPP